MVAQGTGVRKIQDAGQENGVANCTLQIWPLPIKGHSALVMNSATSWRTGESVVELVRDKKKGLPNRSFGNPQRHLLTPRRWQGILYIDAASWANREWRFAFDDRVTSGLGQKKLGTATPLLDPLMQVYQ